MRSTPIPSSTVLEPGTPSFINMDIVVPFIGFVVVIIATVVLVKVMAKAGDGKVSNQVNVGVALMVPILFLILVVGGAIFGVAGYFAGWFVTGTEESFAVIVRSIV